MLEKFKISLYLQSQLSPFCDLLPTLPPLPHVCQLCGLQWTGTLGSQASARTGLAWHFLDVP